MSEAEYCPDSNEGEEADAVLNRNTQQSGEHHQRECNPTIETIKAALRCKHLDTEDVQL